MEKPHDLESLAWYLHEFPKVIMVVNNDSRRLVKYGGIKKGALHFIAGNGLDMKFELDKPYSAPIEYKTDHFVRYVTPSMVCQYFYTTDQDVKQYEWDELLVAVRAKL